MSVQVKRALIRVCMLAAGVALAAELVRAAVTGRWDGSVVAAAVFCSVGLVAGCLFLRSTRGRS